MANPGPAVYLRAIAAAVTAVVSTATSALAQSPTPRPQGPMGGGVPASMSGDPVLAAVAVIGLGLATALITMGAVWVRRRFEARPR